MDLSEVRIAKLSRMVLSLTVKSCVGWLRGDMVVMPGRCRSGWCSDPVV